MHATTLFLVAVGVLVAAGVETTTDRPDIGQVPAAKPLELLLPKAAEEEILFVSGRETMNIFPESIILVPHDAVLEHVSIVLSPLIDDEKLQIEDELLTGFHVEWDGSLGFLRIAGEATASDYLRVLRSIQYVNPTGTPGNRKLYINLKALEQAIQHQSIMLRVLKDSCFKSSLLNNGQWYRGNISKTASGRTCQSWSVQTPHAHQRTPSNFPGAGLESNYCRNPDSSTRPWCFTTDPFVEWEICNICSEQKISSIEIPAVQSSRELLLNEGFFQFEFLLQVDDFWSSHDTLSDKVVFLVPPPVEEDVFIGMLQNSDLVTEFVRRHTSRDTIGYFPTNLKLESNEITKVDMRMNQLSVGTKTVSRQLITRDANIFVLSERMELSDFLPTQNIQFSSLQDQSRKATTFFSEQEEYSIFLMLLVSSNSLPMLSRSDLSLFVPTNKAFESIKVPALLADANRLQAFVARHFVENNIILSKTASRSLVQAVSGTAFELYNQGAAWWLGGIPIVLGDIVTSGVTIHGINQPLPQTVIAAPTLSFVLNGHKSLSYFKFGAELVGISFEKFQGTLLIPSENAFAKSSYWRAIVNQGQQGIVEAMNCMQLPYVMDWSAVTSFDRLSTMGGTSLAVAVDQGGNIEIEGVKLDISNYIGFSSGQIFQLPSVFQCKTDFVETSHSMIEHWTKTGSEYSILHYLLVKGGLLDTFMAMINVTIFVPSNTAFESWDTALFESIRDSPEALFLWIQASTVRGKYAPEHLQTGQRLTSESGASVLVSRNLHELFLSKIRVNHVWRLEHVVVYGLETEIASPKALLVDGEVENIETAGEDSNEICMHMETVTDLEDIKLEFVGNPVTEVLYLNQKWKGTYGRTILGLNATSGDDSAIMIQITFPTTGKYAILLNTPFIRNNVMTVQVLNRHRQTTIRQNELAGRWVELFKLFTGRTRQVRLLFRTLEGQGLLDAIKLQRVCDSIKTGEYG